MAIGPENRTVYRTSAGTQAQDIDQGLRSYMLGVYNYMGTGLVVTAAFAWLFARTPALLELVYQVGPNGGIKPTILGWVAMFAPLGVMLYLSTAINRIASGTAQILYWVFTALMGISLSYVAILYTGESIAQTFMICACTFLGMSLFGYVTKRDLTGMGSFLIMGVWGIFLASIVNIFLGSGALHFAISVLGVLIFTGLTAYDTQQIKYSYAAADGREIARKKSVMGAIRLYLDFVNLFLFLLQMFGNRR
jgi:FtsH-binding integral membrane protein